MRKLIAVLFLFGICLTQEQFNNLMLIHSEIQRQEPAFIGFKGDIRNLECLGVKEERVKEILDNIDIGKLKGEYSSDGDPGK